MVYLRKLLTGIAILLCIAAAKGQTGGIPQHAVVLRSETELSSPHLFYNTGSNELHLTVFSNCDTETDGKTCDYPVWMSAYRYTANLALKDSFFARLTDCTIDFITNDGHQSIFAIALAADDTFTQTQLFTETETNNPENNIPSGTRLVVFKYNLVQKKLEWATHVSSAEAIGMGTLTLEYAPWGLLLHRNKRDQVRLLPLVINRRDTVATPEGWENIAVLSPATGAFTQTLTISTPFLEHFYDFTSLPDTAVYYSTWGFTKKPYVNILTVYKFKNRARDTVFSHTTDGQSSGFVPGNGGKVYYFCSYNKEFEVDGKNNAPGEISSEGEEGLALLGLWMKEKKPVFIPPGHDEYYPTLFPNENNGLLMVSEPNSMVLPELYITEITQNGAVKKNTVSVPEKTTAILDKTIYNGYLYCYGLCEYPDINKAPQPYYPFIFRAKLP